MSDLMGQIFLWAVDWLESKVSGPWRRTTRWERAGKLAVWAITLLLVAGGVWGLLYMAS